VLNAVTAASPDDVWAVGTAGPGNQQFVTLTEHYDGTSWHVVTSPNLGDADTLIGVASAGSGQVWATGNRGSSTSAVRRTLVEHYS
jgi:hypothetical protein